LYSNDEYNDFEIQVVDNVFEISNKDLTSDSESELSVTTGSSSNQ